MSDKYTKNSKKLKNNVYYNDINGSMDTEYVNELIPTCLNPTEFVKQIAPIVKKRGEAWAKEVAIIVKDYEVEHFAKLCGVHRTLIYAWQEGTMPAKREILLRVGILGRYSVAKFNKVLTDCYMTYELYPKELRDAICIFVSNQNYASGEEALAVYDDLYERLSRNTVDRHIGGSPIETYCMNEKLSNVKDKKALERFVEDNTEAFATRYNRICASFKSIIIEWYLDEQYVNFYKSADKITANTITNHIGWKGGMAKLVRSIFKNRWVPDRRKVIQLGIWLNFTKEQIDEILVDANMRALYPKNFFESMLIYALENAKNPEEKVYKGEDTRAGDLAKYVRRVLDEFMYEFECDSYHGAENKIIEQFMSELESIFENEEENENDDDRE